MAPPRTGRPLLLGNIKRSPGAEDGAHSGVLIAGRRRWPPVGAIRNASGGSSPVLPYQLREVLNLFPRRLQEK